MFALKGLGARISMSGFGSRDRLLTTRCSPSGFYKADSQTARHSIANHQGLWLAFHSWMPIKDPKVKVETSRAVANRDKLRDEGRFVE